MRKYWFIAISLLRVFCLHAQQEEWAEVGTRWYYEQFDFTNELKIRLIESVGDTVIKGVSCKVFEGDCTCGLYTRFMYSEGEKVFRYDYQSEDFHLLYDFGAEAGDTVRIFVDEGFEELIFIDSVSFVEVNGETLKVQHISGGDTYYFGEAIIENIGSNLCLTPMFAACDPWTGPILCYIRPGQDYITFGSYDCDSLAYLTASPKLESPRHGFRLYPNPASTFLALEGDGHGLPVQLSIFNLEGKELKKISQISNFKKSGVLIDVKGLKNGFYFLKAIDSQGLVWIYKFVKD